MFMEYAHHETSLQEFQNSLHPNVLMFHVTESFQKTHTGVYIHTGNATFPELGNKKIRMAFPMCLTLRPTHCLSIFCTSSLLLVVFLLLMKMLSLSFPNFSFLSFAASFTLPSFLLSFALETRMHLMCNVTS